MINFSILSNIKWLMSKIDKNLLDIDIDIKKYIINDYFDFKRYFYEGKNKIDLLIRNNQYSLFMIKSIEKDIYRSNCYLYEFYRHNLDFKTNVSIRKIRHDLNEVLYLLKKIT